MCYNTYYFSSVVNNYSSITDAYDTLLNNLLTIEWVFAMCTIVSCLHSFTVIESKTLTFYAIHCDIHHHRESGI